ncbi:MAG: hypothetical protein R2797_09075 [Gelidibacter sp.]
MAADQFDNSYLGLYKGLFSTNDGLTRGTVVVTLSPSNEAIAKITLSSGVMVELKSSSIKLTADNTISNLHFSSEGLSNINATLDFSVGGDGTNPVISDVNFDNKASDILIAKNLSRAPLTTVTGTYMRTAGTGGFPTSGRTWNVMSVGFGDQTYSTQIWYGGRLYNTTDSTEQSNCTDTGDFTTCEIAGSASILGYVVNWSGTHTYDRYTDNVACSEVSGTWSAPDYQASSGTFVSDTDCSSAGIANDFCEDALPVSVGDDITGFTDAFGFTATNGDTPVGNCDDNLLGSADGIGVWYTFTSPVDIDIVASTDNAGTDFDTQMRVFSGTCGSLDCVANNDDVDIDNFNYNAEVQFSAQADVTYYIFLGGWNTSAGTYELTISEFVPPLPEPDACADAYDIACNSSVSGSTAAATNADAPADCNGITDLTTAPGVWYKYTASEDANLTVDTVGSAFDTKLGVFSGDCGTLLCVGANDDTSGIGTRSRVVFDATSGTTYYFYVTGYQANSGDYTLNVSCVIPEPAPMNDLCSGAFPIVCGGSDTGNTTFSTSDDLTSNTECSVGIFGSDNVQGVWYTYTAGENGDVTVSTEGSDFDTHIKVFTGACDSYTCVVADDDSGVTPEVSSIATFTAVSGTTYYIYLGGYNSATGNYVIDVSCVSGRLSSTNASKAAWNSDEEKVAYLKQKAIKEQKAKDKQAENLRASKYKN